MEYVFGKECSISFKFLLIFELLDVGTHCNVIPKGLCNFLMQIVSDEMCMYTYGYVHHI